MSQAIRKEILFSQPPEKVWAAIANRDALAEWMYPNDFEPQVGHRFAFQVPPNPQVKFEGLTVRCEVLTCEPPTRLEFSWSAAALVDTRVSFLLEPTDDGTRLSFEHSGFEITEGFGPQAFKGAEYGWAMMLKQLAAKLAES